jgi:oligoribonuclease NrnB/cAMP/cGMP phosphodiesterase (DHH superfamily)
MKCFYHSSDLDGKCSAAIVLKAFPDCELIPINYNDPFPWDILSKDEVVYMVDFSLQPFADMLRLAELVDLTWIDHHKTAIEEAYNSCNGGNYQFNHLLRDGTGACALVWEYLFDEPMPRAVKLLAEYDVWNHEDPDCLPFQYGLRNLDTNPEANIWACLFDEYNNPNLCKGITSDGYVILGYEAKQNAIKARAMCFTTELDGLTCLAANQGITNSKFFDSVWDSEKYDAMLLFNWRKSQWNISLYTDRPDIDVGEVAKLHGGGGHKGAAGFQCTELPFKLK